MAEVIYNGVTLPLANTRELVFEPLTSDDGADYQGTRLTLDMQCTVNAAQFQDLYPLQNATQIMGHVEHALNTPRKSFAYNVNGTSLVTINPPDLANGPRPGPVRVVQVNDQTYVVQFRLEATFIQCDDGLHDTNPLWTSHRWTDSVDLDNLEYSTHVRRGTIISRADMLVNPDSLRYLVAPPVERGFQRKSARYTLSSDALRLEYEFKDQEVFLEPPQPAWEVEGDYWQTSTNGAKQEGEVKIRMRARKDVDKGALLARAIDIGLARLAAADVAKIPKSGAFFTVGGVRENLYGNEVEVRLKCILRGTKERYGTLDGKLSTGLKSFGHPPLYSDAGTPPPPYTTRGSANLSLIAAALQDPCLQRTSQLSTGPGSASLVARGSVPEARVTISTLPAADMKAVIKTTAPNDAGVFTTYDVDTEYVVDGHGFQVPVATPGAPAEIVQTAATTLTRVVRITAGKIGEPPALPEPRSKDPNLSLLKATYGAQQAEPIGDGYTLYFFQTAEFRYAAKDGSKVSVAAAVPPWVDLDSAGKTATLKTFDQSQLTTPGIIDLAESTQGGPTLNFLFGGATLTTGGGGGSPTNGPGN